MTGPKCLGTGGTPACLSVGGVCKGHVCRAVLVKLYKTVLGEHGNPAAHTRQLCNTTNTTVLVSAMGCLAQHGQDWLASTQCQNTALQQAGNDVHPHLR